MLMVGLATPASVGSIAIVAIIVRIGRTFDTSGRASLAFIPLYFQNLTAELRLL